MTKLDSIFKSRDITLPTKVHLLKAMVFLEVIYGCESWSIKKLEHFRIDAFELWWRLLRRLLRVPWTARRFNQSILKEISPEYSLEGLMLRLKLPILWPPDAKNWLIWKDPAAGKDWRRERGRQGWGGWMASQTQRMWVWVDSRSWWWTGRPGVLYSTGSQSRTWLSDWTELNLWHKENLTRQTILFCSIDLLVYHLTSITLWLLYFYSQSWNWILWVFQGSFKNTLVVLIPLSFHIHFRNSWQTSTEYSAVILTEIALNLQISLGELVS